MLLLERPRLAAGSSEAKGFLDSWSDVGYKVVYNYQCISNSLIQNMKNLVNDLQQCSFCH